MKSKAELMTKYPYMFEGPNIGIDLYDGCRRGIWRGLGLEAEQQKN